MQNIWIKTCNVENPNLQLFIEKALKKHQQISFKKNTK